MNRPFSCWPALALGAFLSTQPTLSAQAPQPEPDIENPEVHAAIGVRLKAAIDAGHTWLKAHKEQDGRFSASAFVVHDPRGKPTDGPGKPDQDVFVTSLVIKSWGGMAWLPDGGGENGEGTHPHVVKATEWLFSQVQKDGSIGLANASTLVRDTGTAAEVLHWAGVYYPEWSDRWESWKSAEWLAEQRLKSGRWSVRGGSTEPDWATDMLATSFLHVAAGGVEGNGPFASGDALRACSADEAGGAAYVFAWAISNNTLRTAACEQLLQHLPRVHGRKDGVDYLGWYGATQGMQFEPAAAWSKWWRPLVETGLKMQRQDGSFAGSWDPLDVRGRECGRIYATAVMLLALEVVWRKEYRDR